MLRAGVIVDRGGKQRMRLWHRDAAPAPEAEAEA